MDLRETVPYLNARGTPEKGVFKYVCHSQCPVVSEICEYCSPGDHYFV